ncbi:hypothetical protein O3M35_004789 [Rhynocoris fuscipes]|uniref:Reverse transcriptase zinc-binding domain-containing protein n=1 Tax=Rhynocoris fuscipes TaxID=488301 RepID=A0AAW1DL69_9HEMI
MVRLLETGTVHIKWLVVKRALNWLLKVLKMNKERYPRVCLDKLRSIPRDSTIVKYNWFSQLFQFLHNVTNIENLYMDNVGTFKQVIPVILADYDLYLRNQDIESLNNSSFSTFYYYLYDYSLTTQPYLLHRLSIAFLRVYAQLRTSGHHHISLHINNSHYTINPQNICNKCDTNSNENLEHILLTCPAFSDTRLKYLSPHALSLDVLLGSHDQTFIKQIYLFLNDSLSRLDNTPNT